MNGRALFARFAVGLLAVLGFFASPAAEASVSVPRDVSSIKADPFAALPQLTSKPVAETLAAAHQADKACIALCELAASIDADPFGYGVKPRPFGGRATPFGRQYFYANGNPTFFTDPTGRVAVVDNFLGGALSTVIGFGVTCATKGCAAYMPEDAAVDFSLGFASSGLSGLKALKYAKEASRLANAAKISGRVAAQYGVGLAGEVTRHELKGEEYTVEEVSQQAVVGAVVGEGGDLLAKGVDAGARRLSSGLSRSESDIAKLLTRDASSFVPRSVREATSDALESVRDFTSRVEFGVTPGLPGTAMAGLPTVRLRPSAFTLLERRPSAIYEVVDNATGNTVYVGKTVQLGGSEMGTNARLRQHVTMKPEWQGRQYEVRTLGKGNWTEFETATHEMKAIMERGGPRRLFPESPLQNRNRSITPWKFEKYRSLHSDYDPNPFGGE